MQSRGPTEGLQGQGRWDGARHPENKRACPLRLPHDSHSTDCRRPSVSSTHRAEALRGFTCFPERPLPLPPQSVGD